MPAKPTDQIESLALAVVGGMTIRRWAREHETPERTAYEWARTPEFRQRVGELRADLVNRALGRLARSAGTAVKALERIISHQSTAPDAVRVAAAKAILSALIDVQTHAELNDRLTALEQRLAGRVNHARDRATS
jgi:hypothetical protein